MLTHLAPPTSMCHPQLAIDREVRSGAHVSRNRDAALKQVIFLAASK